MTGLIAGTVLQQHGIEVAILDKGRGIGGRLASRRMGAGVCDYGMQYFTVSDRRFRVWVDEWLQQDVVREWTQDVDGRAGYRGTHSSRSIAQHLAANLNVRTQTFVVGVSWTGLNWQIESENTEKIDRGDSLLITAPIPQTLALLDNSHVTAAMRSKLDRVTYRSCLAVLALLDRPSSIPPPGGLRLNDPVLAWVADNHQKGISPLAHTVTLHATPEFSRTHWDADDRLITERLSDLAAPWLQASIVTSEVRRWLYSQPHTYYPGAYLACHAPGLFVLAGDAFSETPATEPSLQLQTAVLSGLAAAEYLLGN